MDRAVRESTAGASSVAGAESLASRVYRALADHEWEAAVALVEDNWGELTSFHIDVVRAVADALPEAVLAEHPRWLSVRRFLVNAVSARRTETIRGAALPVGAMDRAVQLAEASVHARRAADFDRAAQFAEESLGALGPELAVSRHADEQLLPALLQQLGFSFYAAAREDRSVSAFSAAYAMALASSDARSAANAAGELAWIHTLAGRGRTAEEWIDRQQSIAAAGPELRKLRGTVHLARALRLHDELRPEEAALQLKLAAAHADPVHGLSVAMYRVIFELLSADRDPMRSVELVRAQARDAGPVARGRSAGRFMIDYTLALGLAAAGRPAAALPILDGALRAGGHRFVLSRRAVTHYLMGDLDAAEKDADAATATTRVWPRSLVEALVVKAATFLHAGCRHEVRETFTQAVRLAGENGLLASLAVIPIGEFRRLSALSYADAPPPELRRVLAHPDVFAVSARLASPLTSSESRVLRLLATGVSARSAAEELGVSEHTVRTHTRGIYRKLGVSNRAEFAAAAAGLGLI